MAKQAQQKILNLQRTYQETVRQGKWVSAFKLLKNIMDFKKQNSLQNTQKDCTQLAELANFIAMQYLREASYEKALKFLQKAVKYCRYCKFLSLITYNNLGCYYKKIGQSDLALLNINKAIAISKNIDSQQFQLNQVQKNRYLADCHLNLCAILSTMKQHNLAYQNATIALNLIEGESLKQENSSDRHNVHVITLFNIATELEHLKRYQEAISGFQILIQYIMDYMTHGQFNNPMIKNAQKAIFEIKLKLSKRKSSSRMANTVLLETDRNSIDKPKVSEGRKSSLSSRKSSIDTLATTGRKSFTNRLILNSIQY